MHSRILSQALVCALLAGAFATTARAAPSSPGVPQSSPLGTAIAYRGQLRRNGAPVTAACAFSFSLWDSAESGAQIGGTVVSPTLAVSAGLFTIPLDFGPGAFNGENRWLETVVQCPGDGAPVALAPRAALLPAPYALALPGLRTPAGSASGSINVLGGRAGNAISADASDSVIAGGRNNVITASVTGGIIAGGVDNQVWGSYGYAAGRRAQALHQGAFVWGDSTDEDVTSTANDQFIVRASGGVRFIGNGAAPEQLAVAGVISTTAGVKYPDGTIQTTAFVARPLPGSGSVSIVDNRNPGSSAITIGADGLPLVSYFDSAEVFRVLHCGNAACSGGNTVTNQAGIGCYGQQSSVSIGPDGLATVAYIDACTRALKAFRCRTVQCDVASGSVAVDAGASDLPSTVIGADGLPLVAYRGVAPGLRVAHCGALACDSGNTLTTLDGSGITSSLAIGADGLGLIAYLDAAHGALKVFHCGTAVCDSGNMSTTVDGEGGNAGGSSIGLAIGPDGLGLMSYYDSNTQDLVVAHCGTILCDSGIITTTVDAQGNVGQYSAIAIGSDGLGLIAYWDATQSDLKVVHCGNALCNAGNLIVTLDSAGQVGDYPSLTIGADGLPVISYHDITNADLKAFHCSRPTCAAYTRVGR